jgi:hypothetical protein
MPDNFTDGVGNKYVIQTSITAIAAEAYTDARRISASGIVSGNSTIDPSQETFIGQLKWDTPMNNIINIASLVDPTNGVPSNFSADFLNYIKTARTQGAYKVNLTELVTKEDALTKMGTGFANGRVKDEENAFLAVLKGVAFSEAFRGAASVEGASVGLGGQTFDNDPTNRNYGFYVDLGNNPLVSSVGVGAARVFGLVQALGMAWKDYEPDYAYLVIDPALMANLRSANLIDTDRVSDGPIEFESIFSGKFRLVMSRTNTSFNTTELAAINGGSGVDIVGTRTSFVVLPGAIAFENLTIPKPTGIDENEASYHGGGSTDVWNRWGYVMHPVGYDWRGPTNKFPSDADYKGVTVGDGSNIVVPITDASVTANTNEDTVESVWRRKATSALTMGILPVFHG